MISKESLEMWWKEIEAWKNGAVIEQADADGNWNINRNPEFQVNCRYRIKPEQKIYMVLDMDIEAMHNDPVILREAKNMVIDFGPIVNASIYKLTPVSEEELSR